MYKQYLLFTLLLFYFSSFGQNPIPKQIIYVDENNKQVDEITYYEKCGSFLYLCNKRENDSLIINSIFEKYRFGKLSQTETKQVQQILSKNTNNQELKDKTIIISYREIIYGHEEQKALKKAHTLDKHNFHSQSESKYLLRRKKFDKNQNKCFKKYKSKNIFPLYLYNTSKGYSYTSKYVKWYKIYPVIDKLFFNYKYPMMLIIKPDGSYFRYLSITESKFNDLLKNDWTPYVKDYQIAKTNLSKRKIGFFTKIDSFKSKRLRFHIDDDSKNFGKPMKKVKLPPGTIRIRNRSEISQYFDQNMPCFTFSNF